MLTLGEMVHLRNKLVEDDTYSVHEQMYLRDLLDKMIKARTHGLTVTFE